MAAYCVRCNWVVGDIAPACPRCGQPRATTPTTTGPSTGTKAALSAVRIFGCLTVFGGVAVAFIGFAMGGVLGLAVGVVLMIIGIAMAMVSRVS